KFFPEMPNAAQITIAQLLNHTSGLADYVNENLEWIVSPHTKVELLEKISKASPHFEPGAKQVYSNGNYLILRYILEKITGKTYPVALKSRILDKIGLKNTIAGTVNSSQPLEARSYKQMTGWNPVTDIYFPDVVGVGDILSTPQDLLTFIQALMSGKMTSAESLSKMKSFEGPQTLAMGLLRMPFYSKTVIGHNGGTFGTYSGMYAVPEDGLSFTLCINGLNYNMNDILIAMLSSYYNQPYKIPVVTVVDLKPEDLDDLLGNYTSKDLPLKIAVTKSAAVLVVQATGQPSFPLDAVTKDEFKNEGLGAVLKFDREKHEMTLIQHGKNFHYVIEK
ncbi:Serine-type D-Ala-D-Ala carboxypeptidase, partial [Pedobacter sp. BAL39]|uniref:serine hydrolase domain-containing protein n=1 Tax=Pedobacter sp. BAL39 TaxID=391596 RepID=UPI0001559C11